MAAHAVAAARCSPFQCFVRLVVYVLCIILCMFCRADNTYSQHDLLKIGACSERSVTAEFHRSYGIPVDTARSPGSQWITIPTGRRRRRCRERKQKQGSRAGALARLRRQPYKPPLPSVFRQIPGK